MTAEASPRESLPPPDVGNRPIIMIAIGLMAMMLVAVAGLATLYVRVVPQRALPAPESLPAPQVRTDEEALRKRLEADQMSRLAGYRWIDPQKTLVGIPIERAMQILTARGTKAYDSIITVGAAAQMPGPTAAAANQMPGSRVPSDKEPIGAEKGARQP